jgi:hypothetical protein
MIDPDDSDTEGTDIIPPDEDSDSDLDLGEPVGDVTIPCPVTITDSTNSFLRDMAQGKPFVKPVAYCPECGGEMHKCAKCESGKVCTGEP